MENLLEAALLGIIEGITEFLPISSTGHLLIAEAWLGRRPDLFNIAIQSGAILAVALIYRRRLMVLTLGLRRPANRDYALKLLMAFCITAAGGLASRGLGLTLPETIAPIAWALILGGVAILAIERHVARLPPCTNVTWTVAVAVGLAQVLAAVFPGVSRSAATIFAAMLVGLSSRTAAAEFSFLLGIPTMFAATGYEMLRMPDGVEVRWLDLAVGFTVSGVVAFAAVKGLLIYIRGHSFAPFAWYRIAFGSLLLTLP